MTSLNHRNNQPWQHFTSGLLVMWENACVDYLRPMGLSLISILTGKGKALDNAPTTGNSHTIFPLFSLFLAREALYLMSSGTLPTAQGGVQADFIVCFCLHSVPLPTLLCIPSNWYSTQSNNRCYHFLSIFYVSETVQCFIYTISLFSSFTIACKPLHELGFIITVWQMRKWKLRGVK